MTTRNWWLFALYVYLPHEVVSFAFLLQKETDLLACSYEHTLIVMPCNPLDFDSAEYNAM
jgi:hypothetical protein